MDRRECYRTQDIARFTRYVRYAREDDCDTCWFWMGPTDQSGHGIFNTHGESHPANRVGFTLIRGPIGEDKVVTRTCDQPMCVNPYHLEQRAQQEVLNAKASRGRWPNRFTPEQVREIRSLHKEGARQVDLAEMFGVKQPTISNIVTRRTYKHVT